MWTRLFDSTMRRLFRTGAIEVSLPDGSTRRYGPGKGTPIRVRLHDPALPRKLLMNADMALGEGYMNGTITIDDDDLSGFLALASENRDLSGDPGLLRAWRWGARPVQRWLAHNRVAASRSNVAHHYDLSSGLYDLFLDRDRQYSCAYFAEPDMSLDAAQEAKKRHIARKLCLEPEMRVLDIGCGWGGMAITLARDYGARVTGITLSEEQHRTATDRVRTAGLSDRVEIRLQDYRLTEGPFDRIVSVGMFEHVGAPHYRTYFGKVRDLLTPDGIALIHTIGITDPPTATGAWVRRYIFPGGYLPALSEVVAAIEKEALVLTDLEVLRLHYAETLRHWAERFEARIDAARALYDDRFCRMWRYYLRGAEASFRHGSNVVYQFQLSRHRMAVPLTRDYLYRTHNEMGAARL